MEVTNDGATILKSVGVDNPAAKILIVVSKVQGDEVSDSPSRSRCWSLVAAAGGKAG